MPPLHTSELRSRLPLYISVGKEGDLRWGLMMTDSDDELLHTGKILICSYRAEAILAELYNVSIVFFFTVNLIPIGQHPCSYIFGDTYYTFCHCSTWLYCSPYYIRISCSTRVCKTGLRKHTDGNNWSWTFALTAYLLSVMRHFCTNFFKAWLQSYNEFTWFYFPEKTTTKKTIILTAINFPSEISLSIFVSLPSQVCFCTSLPFSRITTVCRGNRTETSLLTPAQKRPPRLWCAFCPHATPTLVFLSSAVVSSNGSLSLNLISVVLKVLWVFMQTIPWSSKVTTKLGLVRLPTCRVANPTPAGREGNTIKMH